MQDSESVQNLKVSDEIKEILSVEAHTPAVRQMLRPTVTTDSKCVMTLRSQRKRSASNPQNEDERLGIRIDSPKLPKTIIMESSDTKEGELEENRSSMTQQLESEKVISERALFNGKRRSEKEGNLVRLPDSKVESVLKMLRSKSNELKAIQNEQEFRNSADNPSLQEQPLQHSARRKQARIDSWSSKDSHELIVDTEELISVHSDSGTEVVLTQQENVNAKSGEAIENQILDNDNITMLSEKKASNYAVSWKKLDERKSSKDNREISNQHEILSATKSGNRVAMEKQSNTQSSATQVKREITLKSRLENAETVVRSLSKSVRLKEPKKLAVTRHNKQVASEARNRKLTEEGAIKAKDKWKDADQTMAFLQELKMTETHLEKEPVVCYDL